MKKRNLIGALLCSVCLIGANVTPAMADAMKVVTLGADLTAEQKSTMMRYFKVDSNQVQTLTITNEDERAHLSSYVPLEQIGSRTVSCAYVKPTQSGGIKVRTANLNWVTCNMIATTLSTSGVANCEVVAACPFEVSGTGALTGVIMAYETASGQKLDETKKALATEEMVVTGRLGEQVGQNNAINIINQAKMQVIANGVQNADEIYNIVYNIAEQNNMQMSDEQFDKIVSLLTEIAQQNYDYSQMQETLENVEDNVSGEPVAVEGDQVEEYPEDSIVSDLDESVLGDDVIADSTEDPTLAEETNKEVEVPIESAGEEGIPAAEGDGSTEIPEAEGDGSTEIPEAEGDGSYTEDGSAEAPAEDELSTDSLSEDAKALFERTQTFCRGEYEGDAEALMTAMGDGVATAVVLDAETGAKVSKEVQKDYLNILKNGTASYVPSESDSYMSTELNMIASEMRKLFGMEYDETAEDILTDVTPENKLTLFDETMRFFESLYGESAKAYEEVVDESELGNPEEEVPEEGTTEGEMPEEEMSEEEAW